MLVLGLREARPAQAQEKVGLRAMRELQVSIIFLSKFMGVPCSFETNITDLITGNGREDYEGEPRNVLVSGACSPGTSESRAVLNAQATSNHHIFIKITWVYGVYLRGI